MRILNYVSMYMHILRCILMWVYLCKYIDAQTYTKS